MLNLSDNELDRLSREAASQHDPGDPLGPQSWERLVPRLDKELGRAGPDMPRGLRSIRRFPFQYAPVLLLVVGVTYYFVKAKGRKTLSSGSPPITAVKTPQNQPGTASGSSSSNNSAYSDTSTTTVYPGADAPSSGSTAGTPTAPASNVAGPDHSSAASNSGASPARDHNATGTDRTPSGPANGSLSDRSSSASPRTASGRSLAPGSSRTSGGNLTSGSNLTLGSDRTPTPGGDLTASANRISSHRDRTASGRDRSVPGRHSPSGTDNDVARKSSGHGRSSAGRDGNSSGVDDSFTQNKAPHTAGSPGLEYAFVQRPFSLRTRPRISDSALLAYVPPAPPPAPYNYHNHSLAFTLLAAPDFSSVNSLAGDRPGSTLGLTVEYEILQNWHLGTGFLYSRRNYTARGMDYHVPMDYLRQNNIKGVDFVKGTMNMLEIPLTLRYDFGVTGSTLFFASAGVSSYILGRENCNYYYDFFGREVCRTFKYSNSPNGLFSSASLSLGVQTGINKDNTLSIMVAPYMKMPTNDIGFGKVWMNSVGINFGLRFTPLISWGRHH